MRNKIAATLLLSAGATMSAHAAIPDLQQSFTSYFNHLPILVQAEIRAEPDNNTDLPAFIAPKPPGLTVNVMAGASWRMDDGYGMWQGDGESPLATAKDFSEYDAAQIQLYNQNRKELSVFNQQLSKEIKKYTASFKHKVAALVASNQSYQNLLLTYPQAVTKSYVVSYILNRDMALGHAQREWQRSVSHLRYTIGVQVGRALSAVQVNNVDSGQDPYVRSINKLLVQQETARIDALWAPMEDSPLAPLMAFKPYELTLKQAEAMSWGVVVPPASSKPGVVENSPAPGMRSGPGYNQSEQVSPTTAASTESEWMSWLVLLLGLGGGAFWFLRRKARGKQRAPDETDDG